MASFVRLVSAPDDFDAWLLDLDGTLYRARWVKIMMAAELALDGFRAARSLRRFRREHELIREQQAESEQQGSHGREEGKLAPNPFQLQLARAAGSLDMDQEALQIIVERWMIERPGKWLARFKRHELFDDIRTFRAGGGKTALVSDYPARSKLRALGATQLFDVVVASGEPGGPQRLKPHPEGYLRAAESLGVAPERCLVLGDRDDADGAAARAARMSFQLIR
jgi:HAD superfamily hydrolase (TIGR01549 family)